MEGARSPAALAQRGPCDTHAPPQGPASRAVAAVVAPLESGPGNQTLGGLPRRGSADTEHSPWTRLLTPLAHGILTHDLEKDLVDPTFKQGAKARKGSQLCSHS